MDTCAWAIIEPGTPVSNLPPKDEITVGYLNALFDEKEDELAQATDTTSDTATSAVVRIAGKNYVLADELAAVFTIDHHSNTNRDSASHAYQNLLERAAHDASGKAVLANAYLLIDANPNSPATWFAVGLSHLTGATDEERLLAIKPFKQFLSLASPEYAHQRILAETALQELNAEKNTD